MDPRSSKVKQTLTFAADGNSALINWPGGKGNLQAFGTFGSGSIKLAQCLEGSTTAPNGTATPIGSAYTLTADGGIIFDLLPSRIQVQLTGSTAPTITVIINSETPSS